MLLLSNPETNNNLFILTFLADDLTITRRSHSSWNSSLLPICILQKTTQVQGPRYVGSETQCRGCTYKHHAV